MAIEPHSDFLIGGLSVTGAAKVTWHFDPPYDRNDLTRQRLLYTSPFDNRYFAFFLDPLHWTSEKNYEHGIVYIIGIESDKPENIFDLEKAIKQKKKGGLKSPF